MFYCYKITNLLNNKIYIGKTKNIKTRWNEHQSRASNEKSDRYNSPLSNAIRKYDPSNFQFEIISIFETESEVNNCEISLISQYQSNINKFGKSFGYNLTDGGDGISGWQHTIETRNKMSKAHKGLRPTKESLIKRSKSQTGFLHTEETKRSLRDNSKTSKLTLDIAEIIREEYKAGNVTHTILGIKYNVSSSNVGLIINNKIWRK